MISSLNKFKSFNNDKNLLLSGILLCNNKYIYGYHKQKKYKLFKPFNNNFPNFIVLTEESLYNKIIIIKFHKWLNNYPVGINIETIGILNTDNDNISLKSMYSKSLLYYNGYSNLKNIKHNLTNIYNNYTNYDYYNNSFDFICNIDPPFTKNIDDVIYSINHVH